MYNPDLQRMLEGFQEAVGETPHVYYQPPENVKLVYPCFVYSSDGITVIHSNGKPYLHYDEYVITYITKQASPLMVKSMINLPRISYDRHFTSENLHHYVFNTTTDFKMDNDVVDLSEPASYFLGGNDGSN